MATTATTSAPTTMARAFPLTYFVIAFVFTGFFWTLAARGLIEEGKDLRPHQASTR